MIISQGIAERDFDKAAALYWEAFGEKLGRTMGPAHKGRAFVRRVLGADHGIAAHDAKGKLLGIAGFKTADGALVGGSFTDLRAIYGLGSAVWRGALLHLLERDTENTRFLMDGIFVDPAARGQGVGTALLDAISKAARARGYTEVRLDVIDSNPRARALYERAGFVAIKTQPMGLLRFVFGFKSATTMVKQA